MFGYIENRLLFQIDKKIRSPNLKLDIACHIFDEDDIFVFDDRIKICLFPSNIHLPTQLDHSKYFHLKNMDRIYYSCKYIFTHKYFMRDDNYIIFRLRFDENQILYVELNSFKALKKDGQISMGGYAFICADPNLFMNLVFESKKTKEKEKKSYYQSLLEDNVKVEGFTSLKYFGPDKEAIYKSLKEDDDGGGMEVKSLTFMCNDIISDDKEKFLSNFPHFPTALKNNIKEICNVKEEYKENVTQTDKMKRKVVQNWEYDKRRRFSLVPDDCCCGFDIDIFL